MERKRAQNPSACLAARPHQRVLRVATGLLLVLALGLLAGCAEEGEPPKAPGSLSFATDIQPIFTSGGCYSCHGAARTVDCTSCHSPPGDTRGAATITDLTRGDMLSLASYATTGGALIVSPGSSATSTLWWAVNGDPQYSGVAAGGGMPGYMSTLGSNDKATIKAWIDGGANP